MRAAVVLVLSSLLFACSSTPEKSEDTPPAADAGTGEDGSADAGSATPDAGAAPCRNGDTETCPGVAAGTCKPGERTCEDGRWGPCLGRIQPAPGACEFPNCADEGGMNPGCDCVPDTVEPCYDGRDGSAGSGTCAFGFRRCRSKPGGSEWGPCERQVQPTPQDDCSGRDSDCNAVIDDAASCGCTAGQTRPCAGVSQGSCAPGTQTCTNGRWGECTGAVQPRRGRCDEPSCAGGPNPGCMCVTGATESCYSGLHGTMDAGTCRAGTRTCEDGRWGPCLGQERPIAGLCVEDSCAGGPNPGCG